MILKDEGPIRCSGQKGTSWDSWRRSPRLSLGSRNANPPGAKSGCFRALLHGFLGLEFSGLAHVAPLDVIGRGCQTWVPAKLSALLLLCRSQLPVQVGSRMTSAGLSLFPFPKDSSAHAAESARQTLSLCCILVGRTTFLSKREIKAQDILGAGC